MRMTWFALVLIAILQSSDVGRNLLQHPTLAVPIESVAFWGTDRAWLALGSGDILATRDSGGAWEKSRLDFGQPKHVSFVSANLGWAVNAEGFVYHTRDGGRSWVKLGSQIAESEGGAVAALSFVNESTGWAIGPFSAWQTEDGGLTWVRRWSAAAITSPDCSDLPGGAYPISPDSCWIMGQSKVVFRTTNRGGTWLCSRIPSSPISLRDLHFVDSLHGWLCGWSKEGGLIFSTDDGGETWRLQMRIGSPAGFSSLSFVNKQYGWAAGDTRAETGLSAGLVYRTADGGQSWTHQATIPEAHYFRHVHFADSERGWLIGYDKVYRTDNGGRDWRLVLDLRR
jgi:photosystem II stability/assembly factor-like uncharacterized protein